MASSTLREAKAQLSQVPAAQKKHNS